MAQEEQYGTRGMEYSSWHRRQSTRRFVGIENAQLLSMIDMDVILYVEYDDKTKEPIALIEVAMDVGQPYKTATVTKKLSERADIPSIVVLYKLSNDNSNPADMKCMDIESFRVKRLYPKTEYEWRTLTPQQYAEMLLTMRQWSSGNIDRGI